MNKTKKVIISIIIIIIIIMAFFIMTDKNQIKENMKYKKVIVIGLDGMDYQVTSQLIKEGKLPNFKELADRGTFSKLETINSPQSPVVWTTIATGVNPGKHNIFDFIRREKGSYMPTLSLVESSEGIMGASYKSYVKAEQFWKITSKNDIKTTVIRWPLTFPPEKIKGNLLAGLGVPDIKGLLSGYTYYTEKDILEDKKNVHVEVRDNKIETLLSGPKIRKSSELVDVKISMRIEMIDNNNEAEIEINGQKYIIKKDEWSNWLQVEFKIGAFKKVSGIFKVYLINTSPFEMYITTIQINPLNPITDISYPKTYSSELADKIGLYYTLGISEETDGYVDNKIDKKAFIAQTIEIEEEREKMFWFEFEKFSEQDGLFAFVFDTSDRIQHVFWQNKVLENKNKTEEIDISSEIEDYWMKKDKFFGKLLKKIDNETLLIIISDHGFTSFEKAVSINTWLVENNLMELNGEILEGENGALFKNVNWKKTKAYSLGFNSIYLNLKDREKEGVISQNEKEEVINEIILKLEDLKDNKDRKAINKVYKTEEIYYGEYLSNAPDLIIGFNPGFRMSWQTAIGGFVKNIIENNEGKWVGDHLIDAKFVPGVLFSNIKLKINNSVSQFDIVPTILDNFNLKIESDGKSLL